MSGFIELYCCVLSSTDKALYCDFGDCRCWIPLSQVHDDSEVWKAGQEGEILVSEWIAKEKRLI